MASYSVAAGKFGAYEKTLTATVVDKVTFGQVATTVEVVNHDSSAILYCRFDGTDPVAADSACVMVPPGTARTLTVRNVDPDAGNTEVRVVSAGTPKYSVARGV